MPSFKLVDGRLQAIAALAPFVDWPADALARLARASRPVAWPRGARIIRDGARLDALIVVHGPVQASLTGSEGRCVIFSLDPAGGMYGFAPLVDDIAMQHELVALAPASGLVIPYAAVRAELAAAPALWASIAREAVSRGRTFFGKMRERAFDVPRVHLAALLVGLAQHDGVSPGTKPVELPVRLPRERLAEMLGVSRQWATLLVRELTDAGLVVCRYGRVTLLDIEGLRVIASGSINARLMQSAAAPRRGAERSARQRRQA